MNKRLVSQSANKEAKESTEEAVGYVQIEPKQEHPATKSYQKLSRAASIAFLAALIYAVYQRSQMTKGIAGDKAVNIAEHTNVTFKDVKGIDECRAELEEVVDYLKNREKFRKIGAKMPKGMLLTGPPGVGKTLLAKAIAGEAKVKFFYSSGSDFEEVFVGLGSKRVRELFEQAKQNSPCIIFIDEIDALGSSRKGSGFNYNRQSLNQLLVEMDGFEERDNILVVGATNFAESLDTALKRPGRFDKIVDIPLPDVKGREEIIQLYLEKVHHDPKIDTQKVAATTTGMTGADLANLINIAVLNAVKEGRNACTEKDIEVAKDRIIMGVERPSLMDEEEKLNTAFHEVGHALIAHLTDHAPLVHKITILPRGQALGMTGLVPEGDKVSTNRREVLAMIDVAMGGRACEQIFLGVREVTTGCASDLNNATMTAYEHVRGGLFNEKTGLVNLNAIEKQGQAQKNQIDRVVIEILNESYQRVLEKLYEKEGLIKFVAEKLKEKETLTGQEFRDLVKQYDGHES